MRSTSDLGGVAAMLAGIALIIGSGIAIVALDQRRAGIAPARQG